MKLGITRGIVVRSLIEAAGDSNNELNQLDGSNEQASPLAVHAKLREEVVGVHESVHSLRAE